MLPPEKAADRNATLLTNEAADINNRFLCIKDGLQKPIPSLGEPGRAAAMAQMSEEFNDPK
jgi:hypothetical protein